ncbi:MAG: glycosyltransferase family 2 protein, partial [Deltaproteobacteria bacterium]|nr:glycosyltransferase family 2 protein [Deltaproteobacteria bacterium]
MYESAPLPVAGTSSQCSSDHRVSIVVPIYNEVKNLPAFLKALDELKLPCEKELVFIDDCSADGSRALLESFDFSSKAVFIFHSENKGKGSAVRAGIAAATGAFIGIQDA